MEAIEVFGENLNSRLWPIPTKGGTMTTIISFRLSETLRSQLEQEAREREVGLCSLIRQVLSDHVNELKNDSKQNIIRLIMEHEKKYRK